MFIEKIIDKKRAKIKRTPCDVNRASEIGHPCLRYLYFRRVNWKDKQLHSINTQFIFDEGNTQEEQIKRDLTDAGWQLVEGQSVVECRDEDGEVLIRGHIDIKIVIDPITGESIPVEIKTTSPFMFNKFNKAADFEKSKFYYARKYIAQFQFYINLEEAEYGIWILKNKSNGQLKEIPLYRDKEYFKFLLKKGRIINKLVKLKKHPPALNDPDVCESCPFNHICDYKCEIKQLDSADSPVLKSHIERKIELKPYVEEYKYVDNYLKNSFKGISKFMLGDYFIDGKEINIKERTQTVKAYSYWRGSIKNLKTGEKA